MVTRFKKKKGKDGKSFPNKKFDIKRDIPKGRNNDITWYSQNPLLMKIAGTVNFLSPAGSNLGTCDNVTVMQSTGQYDYVPERVPGIVALNWIPTPGISTDAQSPINRCANKFFTALRLKNFSTSVYDPVDVMFYFLACDSIFAAYAYLTLIYTHAKTYKFTNLYYPKAILEALNVDADDIRENLDDMLFYINMLQSQLSVLRVPKDVYFIARHMHMSAQIYKDSESDKSQLYVFVPQYLYQYDATVPELKTVAFGAEPTHMSFATLKSKVDGIINAILPDEDMNIIAADVQKYLDKDYWTVNQLDWNTAQEPVYNEEMLWQIHNANMLLYTSATGLNITQTQTPNLDTILYWSPHFVTAEPALSMKRIINSDKEDPNPEVVIESTRLMFTVKNRTFNSGNVTWEYDLETCGSEILTNVQLLMFANNNNLIKRELTTFIKYTSNANIIQIAQDMAKTECSFETDMLSLVMWNQFKWHPICYLVSFNSVTGNAFFGGILADLDMYAVIDNKQLIAMNDQSLLSQFDLGSIIS